MPIKLKNRDAIPSHDYETVDVLGLKIPLTKEIPFGGQVELLDLGTRLADGDFGQYEYLLRVFCTFTRRLPKRERVRYEWLANQDLEEDEVAELVQATLTLLNFQQTGREEDSGETEEGNAPTPAKVRAGKKAS